MGKPGPGMKRGMKGGMGAPLIMGSIGGRPI